MPQIPKKTIVDEVMAHFSNYVALPKSSILVIATWVIAAWLAEIWDRFPHLAVTSPEKRCGKTLLLKLLELVTPNPYNTANISPAAIYRLIELKKPALTLLMDELQSISRRGSEASEITRELLNAGIDRKSKVIRCGGKKMNEIHEFSIYCPKVVSLIGNLDGVLADRCLGVDMKRKTAEDEVEHFRSRVAEKAGEDLNTNLQEWATKNSEAVKTIYDELEPFTIENDRMAELLMPLQAVLKFVEDKYKLSALEQYAIDIDKAEQDRMSSGVLLLNACREILGSKLDFISTADLLAKLNCRTEEPWPRWNRGEPMTDEGLARLLKPFGIKPDRQQKKQEKKVYTTRGYVAAHFTDAFNRYLPHPPK